MGLFGFGIKNKRTLASLKQRATVGSTLTMLSNQLNGRGLALPDVLLGKPRQVVAVTDVGLCFDPHGPGGEAHAVFFWPLESIKSFSEMALASQCGTLAAFIDDNTFIVDYQVHYCEFRLDR